METMRFKNGTPEDDAHGGFFVATHNVRLTRGGEDQGGEDRGTETLALMVFEDGTAYVRTGNVLKPDERKVTEWQIGADDSWTYQGTRRHHYYTIVHVEARDPATVLREQERRAREVRSK